MPEPVWTEEMIAAARSWEGEGAAAATEHLRGVDLTGLSPEQALQLGALTAELIFAAEVRGYRKAITALRDKARQEENGGWRAGKSRLWTLNAVAGYLEAIAEEGK